MENDTITILYYTQDMVRFRKHTTAELKNRYQGLMQTVWTDSENFLKEFYDPSNNGKETQANCFRALFDEINKKY